MQTKATGIAGPDYRAGNKTVHQMASGNYSKSQFKGQRSGGEPIGYISNIAYDEWDYEVINGDVFWSKKHRSWIERYNENDPLQGSHPFDSDTAGFNNT